MWRLCRRDPDAFVPGSTLKPYLFTQAIRPDAALSSLLHQHCAAALGDDKALQGFNVTADSFYSSQVCSVPHGSRPMPWSQELQRQIAAAHVGVSQQVQAGSALHGLPLLCVISTQVTKVHDDKSPLVCT